ncbi:MAG: type I-E CRISPR-associated protein Cse1/CasA, partial [bacterium]
MNLLADRWLPIIRRTGTREKIAICDLLSDYGANPVVDLESPRADFYNALYQLLIGIVQVALAPEDEEEWAELWHEPYAAKQLQEQVLSYQDCFEIDSDGPAFMQDFDLKVQEAKEQDLTNLFINLPANEHYSPPTPQRVDAYWAAIALYTLQTFAPSGGRGHRVGLRGGGPLTSLLVPRHNNDAAPSSIWQTIWLNVLSEEYLPTLSGNTALKENSDIFPWMKPTKTSETNGSKLYPEECHPYHMYFAMPRRIRLVCAAGPTRCDLTNEHSQLVVTGYWTKHAGNNYDGSWVHPLNAYAKPRKSGEVPISIKAQPGGVDYRHWMGLACPKETHIVPRVVDAAGKSEYRKDLLKQTPTTLWAAGFSMDNMKARCWYESSFPIYPLSAEDAKRIGERAEFFVERAIELVRGLQSTIKEAWFSRPRDVKGNIDFLGTSFWQNTESDFYHLLDRMVNNLDDDATWATCAADWRKRIISETRELFDRWALAQQQDGLN